MPVDANTVTLSSQGAATKPGGAHIPNPIAMEYEAQKTEADNDSKSVEKEEKEDEDNA